MRTNMLIYEGAFVNIETNAANENIQQLFALRIFDTETVIGNTYNILYRVRNNYDGTQTVIFTYNEIPNTVTAISVGYDATDIAVTGRTGAIITIPQGDYEYSLLLDATRYVLTEGEIIDLEMGETPLTIANVDNDEDKFTPIKSKQVEIEIHSSGTVDISKFADGGDNRFYVEIESQAEGIIFIGFLSVSDLRQEFLPDPNIITLTATDGLGFLKDEPLLNFDDNTPSGAHSIILFLAWALAKTGLSLDIKACMNIREEFAVPLVSDDDSAGHFYQYISLDAKTFEDEIGTCEDCFTVLEKILAENSYLSQYKGKWVIIRVDEMETGHEYYFTRWNYLAEWQQNTLETFSKNVGIDYDLSFMNDDAEVSLERPFKSTEETFNYEYPEELVCNIDFSRGVREITPPDLSAASSTGTYKVDCWYVRKISGTVTSAIFIEKLFEYGYEKERYLVFTAQSATGTPFDFTQSRPVEISQGDKIDFSVDWRFRTSFLTASGVTYLPCLIYILTATGDRWYWYNSTTPFNLDTFHWEFRSSGVGEVNYYMPSNLPAGYDVAQWTTVSDSLSPAPAPGKLFIGLINMHQGVDAADNQDSFFSNLNLSIIPLVNGSYQRYTGQKQIAAQENNKIKAIREEQVYISDAPRIAMKGTLLKEGTPVVAYSGLASFGTIGQFEMTGDYQGSFSEGQRVTVTGSASNNIIALITDINYSIIGNLTTVYTNGVTTTEIDATVVITVPSYILAGLFYNSVFHTAGPGAQSDLSPYGQIQVFDVWNQFNRVMRTFEGVIDKTDSSTELPDMLHKYILRDINANTAAGAQYRIFMLLHFEMNVSLCEWSAFFCEVVNSDIAKIYDGHDFKYLTE